MLISRHRITVWNETTDHVVNHISLNYDGYDNVSDAMLTKMMVVYSLINFGSFFFLYIYACSYKKKFKDLNKNLFGTTKR